MLEVKATEVLVRTSTVHDGYKHECQPKLSIRDSQMVTQQCGVCVCGGGGCITIYGYRKGYTMGTLSTTKHLRHH